MAVTVDETGRGEAAEAWYRAVARRGRRRAARRPGRRALRRGGGQAARRDRTERAAGGGAGARLAAVPGPVPEQSYMQLILIAAAVVSALIAEWGTAVLLVALTVLNAIVGLRQQGKARAR